MHDHPERFDRLGLTPELLAIVASVGYTTPTPIQARAIPVAIDGKDIIGIAQTGTGKTLAFGLPLIQRILGQQRHALIVVPTRELALQIDEALRRISRGLAIRTTVLIGGASMGLQNSQLRTNPNIVIGTPGRIIDHLERRSLRLDRISLLVLDEADRMLDMGFAPQMRQILEVVPRERQTLLFSATMPSDIVQIAQKYMQLPLRVEIAPAGTTADRIDQELFIVPREQKANLLDHLLREYQGSVLVFARTKHGAGKVCRIIRGMGHTAAEIHGNRSLPQRKDALSGFKQGRYRILVATDIAARGIDVTGIELVVNYDIPDHAEDYVHRIGRTGRAGQAGQAITFVQPDQRKKIRDIERLVRSSLAITPLPASLPAPLLIQNSIQPAAHSPHSQPTQIGHRPAVHPSWGRPQSPHREQRQRRHSYHRIHR